MPKAGTRLYHCPVHGAAEVYVDAEADPDAVWEQPCPVCGQPAELRQPRAETGLETLGPGALPAVHGDITNSYVSPTLGIPVGSKRDLRAAHQALGVVPLSDRDIRDAQEWADAKAREARAEEREVERLLASGEIVSSVEQAGATPAENDAPPQRFRRIVGRPEQEAFKPKGCVKRKVRTEREA